MVGKCQEKKVCLYHKDFGVCVNIHFIRALRLSCKALARDELRVSDGEGEDILKT